MSNYGLIQPCFVVPSNIYNVFWFKTYFIHNKHLNSQAYKLWK
jgi:hypothetical protein